MSSDGDFIPRARLRTMQIIAAALPLGVLVFLAIILVLVYGSNRPPLPPANRPPIITWMAAFFFAVMGALSFIVPRLLVAAGLKRVAVDSAEPSVGELVKLKQTAMIVGMASLEGAAFFGLVAFLVERQPLILIVPGLALLAMMARFPTGNGVRNWVETHARRVLELRQDRTAS